MYMYVIGDRHRHGHRRKLPNQEPNDATKIVFVKFELCEHYAYRFTESLHQIEMGAPGTCISTSRLSRCYYHLSVCIALHTNVIAHPNKIFHHVRIRFLLPFDIKIHFQQQ